MDAQAVEQLASKAGRQLLASLPPYDELDALQVGQELRKSGYPADLIALVLTQARLRGAAKARWGDVADQLILTPEGAEQATRPQVAKARARRYHHADVTHVADLGCGIGLDAAAFASAGMIVDAYEIDPGTVAAARYNMNSLGLTHQVAIHEADVTTIDFQHQPLDGIFADPSRRYRGKRISDSESWSPPLSWVLNLKQSSLGVKVAPGLSRERVPTDMEFEVVSVSGTVVEAGLYRGKLRSQSLGRNVRARATVFSEDSELPWTITDVELGEPKPEVGEVGQYLHEPDGAVVRAGLVGGVVQQLGGRLLDHRIAYITCDAALSSPVTNCYRVIDVQRFNLKKLRSNLRARGIGSVTIKKRGFATTPEQLRKQLRLDPKASASIVLVLTRIGDDPVVLEVERA